MAHLILLREKNKIKTIRIKGPSVTIGRNPAHDVAMADHFYLLDEIMNTAFKMLNAEPPFGEVGDLFSFGIA